MASSHPIVTEISLLAMPEIRIGFFPDVGVSYYFPQVQKGLGKYLALTACRLNAIETYFLDLTKWVCLNQDKYNVMDLLLTSSFKNKEEWNQKWKSFYKEPDFLLKQNNWINQFQDSIVEALEHKTLKGFFQYLQKTKLDDKKWQSNRENFLISSPTSLSVTWELFERSKHLKELKSFFEMELKIALNMTRHFDFPEGIKALLVDKIKNPKWQPGTIEEVNPAEIDSYFTEEKLDTCLRV